MKFNANGGGGSDPNAIKLKAGGWVQGVLRGEPLEFEQAFKSDPKPKFRFKLNMVVVENGQLTARILEGGWSIYVQLKALSESDWDLEKTFVKVSREGSGPTDTKYTVTPSPKLPTPEQLAKIAAVPLLKLVAPGAQGAPQPPAESGWDQTPPPADEDIPF